MITYNVDRRCVVRASEVFWAALYKVPWWKHGKYKWELAIHMSDGRTVSHLMFTADEAEQALSLLERKMAEST